MATSGRPALREQALGRAASIASSASKLQLRVASPITRLTLREAEGSLAAQRRTGVRVSKGVQIALAALSIGAGLALVLTLGSAGEGTFRYYSDVGSFVTAPSAEIANLPARVHGFVVAGSIAKDLAAGHVDFHVADHERRAARCRCASSGIDVPDLFKDGAEVVVEGRYASGTFLAERVMAKCPSKYEAKPPGQST